MYQSVIKTSRHKWQKKNLVTIGKNGKQFDEMVCENCGMKGKRYGFETVEVSGKYSSKNAFLCPKAESYKDVKSITVTNCKGFGTHFSNLKTGTVHAVVSPPAGYKNDGKGVWVMGAENEPVLLLNGEFNESE